jgi:hypothetical protein
MRRQLIPEAPVFVAQLRDQGIVTFPVILLSKQKDEQHKNCSGNAQREETDNPNNEEFRRTDAEHGTPFVSIC